MRVYQLLKRFVHDLGSLVTPRYDRLSILSYPKHTLRCVSAKRSFFETEYESRGELRGLLLRYNSEDLSLIRKGI